VRLEDVLIYCEYDHDVVERFIEGLAEDGEDIPGVTLPDDDSDED
jgi:pyruvate/oxaloacetate carboxyltransferase